MDRQEETETEVNDESVLEIAFEVTPENCLAADRHARRRLLKKAIPSWATTLYTSAVFSTSLLAAMFISGVAGRIQGVESRLLKVALLLYLSVFLVMLLWRKILLSRIDRLAVARNGLRCGPVRMSLGNSQFRRITRKGESLTDLAAVSEVAILPEIIVIYLDAVVYFCVPRRAFPAAEAEEEFVACLRGIKHSHGLTLSERSATNNIQEDAPTLGDRFPAETAEHPLPGGAAQVIRHPVLVLADGIVSNIRNGLRLAFFLRSKPELLTSSAAAYVAITLFELFFELLQSLALAGFAGHVNVYSFGGAVFHIPLFLLSGFLIARVARRDDLILSLPVIFTAIWIPLGFLASIFYGALGNGWFGKELPLESVSVGSAFFCWWILAVIIATLRMIAVWGRRKLEVFLVFLFILFIPLRYVPRGDLWEKPYDDTETSDRFRIEKEDAFYAQPVLLEQALARLKPGTKGVEDLYFIGFAGYGSQDVFMKETEVIERLFRKRFDTTGRSLVMVNNPATVLKYPVASATALERALRRVGEVMDRDEDILFLYLTSHGSKDHLLSADSWPLELRDIDPAMLKRMLDKAGIRWRVITISACYSGGFIEPLKDERTLVITASDATSNSFGCSSESDFTWFSKAFFDEELRRSHSFTTAFRRAEISIQQREKRENVEPSHPRISLGSAIQPRLLRLEKRLDRLVR
jgi:hypothetical protein